MKDNWSLPQLPPWPLPKAVSLTQNEDGSWTARIFSTTKTGTREECVAWLNANGEAAP